MDKIDASDIEDLQTLCQSALRGDPNAVRECARIILTSGAGRARFEPGSDLDLAQLREFGYRLAAVYAARCAALFAASKRRTAQRVKVNRERLERFMSN